MATKVRLQKFLSECGIASRRRAEELIVKGRVKINGEVVTTLGTRVDSQSDKIEIEGQLLKADPKGIILFHKPRGVVTTMHDPEGRRNISHYLTPRYRSYFPVGRLDYDSSGLLILTNDGELSERLAHPRYGANRVYEVLVEGQIGKRELAKMKRGVLLEDGTIQARAQITAGEPRSTWLEVTITEGRKRVIRRLFEKLGFPVIKLHRISHGPFRLGKIKSGQLRRLTEREYNRFRRDILGET